MSDWFFLPRTLIVIQVIFGSPLRHKAEFRSGDIEDFTAETLGPGNYDPVLSKLVTLGWVNRQERRERRPVRGGRPSKYIYRRTHFGRDKYNELREQLQRFGIGLQ